MVEFVTSWYDINIGDNVIYNGEIYIRGMFVIRENYDMLKKGKSYKINYIRKEDLYVYYKIDLGTFDWFFPIECFYKRNYKNSMSLKYGLR